MSVPKVDVLAVLDAACKLHKEGAYGDAWEAELEHIDTVRAAVADLIEAAKLALGEHTAPNDCYATGPLTGDPYLDLVRCPGCQLAAALARIGSAS